MISYAPLWVTLEKFGLKKEALTNEYGIPKSTIHRLNHNLNVESHTLNLLCVIFNNCPLSDIAEFVATEEDVVELNDRIANVKERK